jgi:transketolase
MEVLEVNYLGNLRTEATHLPSGSKIYTDAPKDNHGQGAYFSPTDLVATAVASCGMTIVGILAERKNWNLTQVKAKVEKYMRAQPRSIEKVVVKYQIAGLEKAKSLTGKGKPILNLLYTEMGYGVDFMVGTHKWHGSPPNDEQLALALGQ